MLETAEDPTEDFEFVKVGRPWPRAFHLATGATTYDWARQCGPRPRAPPSCSTARWRRAEAVQIGDRVLRVGAPSIRTLPV